MNRVIKQPFLNVCLYVFAVHSETNTDRMTGQDVKTKLYFCSCAVAVGLRRLWPTYYCRWPLCALGDLAREPWPGPPRSSYIICHSETQPCQRRFTACKKNNLNAAIPPQRTPYSTALLLELLSGSFICACV